MKFHIEDMKMNDTPPPAGHNNPPDPIDEAIAPFADVIEEAQNWADGSIVETEEQMKAVDALLKELKGAAKEVGKDRDTATKPLHDAWKAEIARWKPTLDDLDRLAKCLVAAVDPFKRKLAEEKAEAQRKAWEEANAARRAAEDAARASASSDIDAQRQIEAAKQAAIDAENAAKAQAKDTVKGMRTVHKHEVTDHRAALHWIAKNDKDAMTAFIDAYVAKNFRDKAIDGVKVWQEKAAF
jgi:chromosome segregation ATPase